jgi:2-oxoglutarate-dependent dioxygenase
VKSYAGRMHGLIVDVADKVASSLGLEQHSFQDWPCQFRMNRYNYTHETVGSNGVQVHTDSGFLTVLQEDECVGGLEVLDPAAGEFVPVDPVAGSFVVNIGDVGTVRILISRRRHHDEQSLTARACRSRFQAWSNGRLHNVKHRVQCVAPVPRISIAMFLLAPKDNRVSAPETRAGSRSSTTKTTGSCGCPPMSAPARRSHGWRRETFAPLADMEPNCVHVDTQLLYAKHRE